jgi:hypothetical protein
MGWTRTASELLLVSLWVAVGIVYLWVWAMFGYAGWGAAFAIWSVLAVPLLLGTNEHLRRSNRAVVHIERGQRLVWITVGSVAVASQLAVTLPRMSWPDTSLFRVIEWPLLVLIWALLIGELAVVGWVSYRVVRQLASSEHDPTAA